MVEDFVIVNQRETLRSEEVITEQIKMSFEAERNTKTIDIFRKITFFSISLMTF